MDSASVSGSVLPRTVVKLHRRKATIIWVALLMVFLGFVYYAVWDTFQSRKNPASSTKVKEGYYKFPDVAICPSYLQGCLDPSNANCTLLDPEVVSLQGFEDTADTFMDTYADTTARVVDAFPTCRVIPLSKATVDETRINNGDIKTFGATFYMAWNEGSEFQFENSDVNTQFVDMFFFNADESMESMGEGGSVDAKVPYSRVNLTTNGEFVAPVHLMVLSLAEFTGINMLGNKQKSQRTFSQTTTTGSSNWMWTPENFAGEEYAFLAVHMYIRKFEYTAIEEVDPVSFWSVLGAIGGLWQFIVAGFGFFFVSTEYQYPDKKMRNFKKTAYWSYYYTVKRCLASQASRTEDLSAQSDVTSDFSYEDLPKENLPRDWAKKQRDGWKIFEFGFLDQDRSPNEADSTRSGAPPPQAAVDETALRPGWMKRIDASGTPYYVNDALEETRWAIPTDGSPCGGFSQNVDDRKSPLGYLPPGWTERTDASGTPYYANEVLKETQWERPTVGSGDSPSVDDKRKSPPGYWERPTVDSGVSPSMDDKRKSPPGYLPAGWTERTDASGTPYYVNEVLKETQWEQPTTRASPPGYPGNLPPGWIKRTHASGTPYYMNTIDKTTQWERPRQRFSRDPSRIPRRDSKAIKSSETGPVDNPAEVGAKADADEDEEAQTALKPTDLLIAGDEWEVLTDELEAGSVYLSKEGGIRLEVQRGSLSGQGPGPVKLHFSAQILSSNGRDYITDTIVHCPANVSFKEPLLLDFLLDDPSISSGKGGLQHVLQTYQVLRKSENDTGWESMEEENMGLVDDSGVTYLRARVYHFTMFGCCRTCDVASGITYRNHSDEMAVYVENTTNKVLLVVTLPLKYSVVNDRRHAINFAAGVAGVELGGGFEREERTEFVSYPSNEAPSHQLIGPQAKKQRVGIRDKGCSQRLLLCTIEDEPPSSFTTPASTSSPDQVAPASDALIMSGQDKFQIVRLYDDHTVSGGIGLAVHQSRVDLGFSRCCRVRQGKVMLAHVAMALAGLSEAQELASGSPPPEPTRRWNPFR